MTKAEDQVMSVAAASIISRYIFLGKMQELSTKVGTILPLGAGTEVDKVAKELVTKNGMSYLNNIAKLNFKNTIKIQGE
jgi:ribonuclease HIII